MDRKFSAEQIQSVKETVTSLLSQGLEDVFFEEFARQKRFEAEKLGFGLSEISVDVRPNFGCEIEKAKVVPRLQAHHHHQWQKNPIYIEFDFFDVKAFCGKFEERIEKGIEELGQYKCRVYFTQEAYLADPNCVRTSLVMVMAEKAQGENNTTVYKELDDEKYYNVGSACPPDCETGSYLKGTTQLAARLAQEQLPTADLKCLMNPNQCKVCLPSGPPPITPPPTLASPPSNQP